MLLHAVHENRHALKFGLLLEGTLNRPSSCDTVKDVLSHLSLVTLSTSFLSWTLLFNEYGVERSSNRLCLVAWLLAVRSISDYIWSRCRAMWCTSISLVLPLVRTNKDRRAAHLSERATQGLWGLYGRFCERTTTEVGTQEAQTQAGLWENAED